MPTLETARLLIRPFVEDDLDAVYGLLDVEVADADLRTDKNGEPSRARPLAAVDRVDIIPIA